MEGVNESRFWSHVDRSGGPDACWRWTGALRNKYGASSWGRAHRVAVALHTGAPVARGMDVCHRCDNPPCCNPAHLFVGTRLDNMRDAKAKGRLCTGARRSAVAARGERGGNARLTESHVIAIRELVHKWGESGKEIAATLGISQSTVSAIVTRRTWAHLGDGLEVARG